MGFDDKTRKKLASLIKQARGLLVAEFTQQLQDPYGIQPVDGAMAAVEQLTHLDDQQITIARLLRERIEHLASGMAVEKNPVAAAIDRAIREQAFTILNRFAALRLCEERGLVEECVRQGLQSKGFKVYETVAGAGLGGIYDRYKQFLLCLFDEIAVDLGVLFDRFSPHCLLFPREPALQALLDLLNDKELSHIWTEDETIGWIYQYFNPPEERKKMREESAAPRNSRELAVRNQFFTPRYVVEFLTDNTLGRIWYEMRKGDTALKEHCRYLVRRPHEVFLAPGGKAPVEEENEAELSQKELLKKPVYIGHRAKKDPRDLKILDPACGSGHFLLYAFDLLETIYQEAWEDQNSPPFEATGHTLREDYETLEALRRGAPELILRHNLHGIDIDHRAVQIAALDLWLRAQKSWQRQGLKAGERPRITKSNIITAEPMPGEADMRKEFVENLRPKVLGQLVNLVFDKMQLAGEAGSLLKIEEEIQEAVAAAQKQWLSAPQREQMAFADFIRTKPKQEELRFDVREITDEDFWRQAEDKILAALRDYAEQVENGGTSRRRLFAEDAARSFAFIDLCRKRYDVVLMNPPFGDMPRIVYSYCEVKYPDTKFDFHTAFMERALQIAHGNGFAAYISNRTWFSLYRLDLFRKNVVLKNQLEFVADLGLGVLDDALVEAACTIMRKGNNNLEFPIVYRLITSRQKEYDLLRIVNQLEAMEEVFLPSISTISKMPRAIFGYWFPVHLVRSLSSLKPLYPDYGVSRQGLATRDDFRFLRLRWEVPFGEIGKKWFHFAKGGEYEPFYDDIHLVIDYEEEGRQLKSYIVDVKGEVSWSRNIPSSEMYGVPGLTYPERTTSDFSPRPLPKNCIFSATGQAIFLKNDDLRLVYLGFAYSRIYKQLIELFIGGGDATESGSAARHYTSGIISEIPFPEVNTIIKNRLIELTENCINLRVSEFALCEDANYFRHNVVFAWKNDSISASLKQAQVVANETALRLGKFASEIDILASESYGLRDDDFGFLDVEVCPNPYEAPQREIDHDLYTKIEEAVSLDMSPLIDTVCSIRSYRRAYTKKAYWADRKIELLAHLFRVRPEELVAVGVNICSKYLEAPVADLISYIIGISYGRWDNRIAMDPSLAPKIPNPFDTLPVCPPGMLLGPDGLPPKPGGIVSESWLRARPNAITLPPAGSVQNPTIPDSQYPLRISWEGILVDDPGINGGHPHQEDIVRRVREVLEVLWGERAHDIEQEACEILGVSELRDYFHKPSGFFQDHLKRYSKSRRKAPIYWPLSTASGSYTLWLYYHRLTDQTLFACVADYVDPKLASVQKDIESLRAELTQGATAQKRQQLEKFQDFAQELKDFREELLRVAALPYKPDLNDGVLITAAPLWKLFRHNQWHKDLQECWQKLTAGDYNWAHLACAIWPDRVKEKCKNDRSLAIAHNLEELYQEDPAKPKKRQKKGKS